jgi:hypothetical protein
MAASSEPDSAAARRLAGTGPAGDQAVVREVIARLDSTLAAPSARIELRYGREDLPPGSGDHYPGRVEQLVSSAARLAWEYVAPEKFRAWWRDLDASLVGSLDWTRFPGRPGQALPEDLARVSG